MSTIIEGECYSSSGNILLVKDNIESSDRLMVYALTWGAASTVVVFDKKEGAFVSVSQCVREDSSKEGVQPEFIEGGSVLVQADHPVKFTGAAPDQLRCGSEPVSVTVYWNPGG